MEGVLSEDCGGGASRESLNGPSEALAEWRSSDQVENGTLSTSPLFWDTDDYAGDSGSKPSELFGKFTWKIDNFPQINKRELRSNAFEVGGYKWYILIYPQGCDVSNHLSLFLCVANHDKLLPGWSHFAQFTIAVVNKEPKKSKYSDTLHRFWKKEHDWGWKKFMELAKVSDGFIKDESLLIKAQVQVIREKAHRPFWCLDCNYRRELLRIYLNNVDQTCRRFIDERSGKISKLVEDKVRWSSFCSFWSGLDQNARRCMSREKTEAILKVVVKHFFIEKEVTSTLVMDSLCSGLKALEFESKNIKVRARPSDMEESPSPMVRVENDLFVLTDDVVKLLERVARVSLLSLPSPTKDDNDSQNRSKDGNCVEESNTEIIEREEWRLTELGRRTLELYVLAHIFSSSIEIAYQETVALKRQEELIREEEAAWQAENEHKARLRASEKEKRLKKKQTKQKKIAHKGKDKGKDDKSDGLVSDKHLKVGNPSSETISVGFSPKPGGETLENVGRQEDISDVSELADDVAESVQQPESGNSDSGIPKSGTDALETFPTMEIAGHVTQSERLKRRNSSTIDDSSSTCSTDSVLSLPMGHHKTGVSNKESQSSPNRGKNQNGNGMGDQAGFTDSVVTSNAACDSDRVFDTTESCNHKELDGSSLTLNGQINQLKQHSVHNEAFEKGNKGSSVDTQVHMDRSSGPKMSNSSPTSPQQPAQILEISNTNNEEPTCRESSSASPSRSERPATPVPKSPRVPPIPKTEAQKQAASPKCSTLPPKVISVSRPSSAPLYPDPKPSAPNFPIQNQSVPLLSRSSSAAGRLGTEPPPHSVQNAITDERTAGGAGLPASFLCLPSSSTGQHVSYPQTVEVKDRQPVRHGLTFGSVRPETLLSTAYYSWRDDPSEEASCSSFGSRRMQSSSTTPCAVPSGQAPAAAAPDEFPHMDIINDLLDEEQQSIGWTGTGQRQHRPFGRQYSLPVLKETFGLSEGGSGSGSGSGCMFDCLERYYGERSPNLRLSSVAPLGGMNGHPQRADPPAFTDGRLDRAMKGQWPYGVADRMMLKPGNSDADGYPYGGLERPSLAPRAGGVYPPSMYRGPNGP